MNAPGQESSTLPIASGNRRAIRSKSVCTGGCQNGGLSVPQGPYWLTFSDAARACQVSRDTIKRYHRAAKFPQAYRDENSSGAPWRVPVADLIEAGLSPDLTASSEQVREQPAPRFEIAAPSVAAVNTSEPASDNSQAMLQELRLLRDRVDALERLFDAGNTVAEARAEHIRDLQQFLRVTQTN
jgi:hypothetical protein